VARKIYRQNAEVKFKAVDDSNEEFDVLVDNQLVGSYNSQTNSLLVVPETSTGTLTGVVENAVIRQFKLVPEVIH